MINPSFKRRGIKIHDTGPDSWDLNKAADLGKDPASVPQALHADPDPPYQGPDLRNQLKRYGQDVNKDPWENNNG